MWDNHKQIINAPLFACLATISHHSHEIHWSKRKTRSLPSRIRAYDPIIQSLPSMAMARSSTRAPGSTRRRIPSRLGSIRRRIPSRLGSVIFCFLLIGSSVHITINNSSTWHQNIQLLDSILRFKWQLTLDRIRCGSKHESEKEDSINWLHLS